MQRVMVLARHMTPRSQPAAITSNASSGASASSATAPVCTPAATPLLANAEHGTVASFPDDFFGYFGWPTLAKMDDGTLVAAASGLRNDHVCPFGRNVICRSFNHGRSWTTPTVVNDSPLDDRDTGAVNLGGGRLLLTWFTSDIRSVAAERLEHVLDGDFFAVAEAEDSSRSSANTLLLSEEQREGTRAAWEAGLSRMTDEHALRFQGAWAMRSDDGGVSFRPPVPCPASAPHGPVMLRDGSLLYLGKRATLPGGGDGMGVGGIVAARSVSLGDSWEVVADVPNHVDMANNEDYHEPHLAELSDGRLLGLIRTDANFSMCQTLSDDRGHTWSVPTPLGFHGSPPHLLVHSSGALVCVYTNRATEQTDPGRRQAAQSPKDWATTFTGFGQRAMVSWDGGCSWIYDYVLRNDGVDQDLGYPSSVEMDDGSILTLYYQKPGGVRTKCALLSTRWTLPERP